MATLILKKDGPKENFINTINSMDVSEKKKINFFHKTFPKAAFSKGTWVDQATGTMMETKNGTGYVSFK